LPAPWVKKPACSNLTVIYQRLPRLFADLELAHGDRRFPRLFRSRVRADLLILDDWGPDRRNAGQRRDLMEIVEDRNGRGSILITSQLPVTAWHDVIDEPTSADAILDRVRHCARTNGASMAHSTTPVGSNSKGIPCGAPSTALPKKLTKAARPDIKNHADAATILR